MAVKILTTADCETRLLEAQTELETANNQPAETHAASKIMVWKRILWHVLQGDTITMDEEENVQLWPREAQA
jgi:hypothetical protein